MWLRSMLDSLKLRWARPHAREQRDRRDRRAAAPIRLHLEELESRLVPSSYVVTYLGTLGGAYSSADDVNVSGQVAGTSSTAAGWDHAFLWTNGAMIDLGTLGGARSLALALNDLGQV